MLAAMLGPTDDQIRALARREADPSNVRAFSPIARGPVFAVLALLALGLLAVPLALVQLVAHLRQRGARDNCKPHAGR